jgi:hypothetical protein
MVAMVETMDGKAVFVGEVDPGLFPLTLKLVDPKAGKDEPPIYGKVKLFPLAVPVDAEPTWEDAAWQ